MSRPFGPAIAGAVMQVFAVILATFGFYWLARTGHLSPPWPLTLCEAKPSCGSASLLVRWVFLITAVGVAFTNNRIVTRTTDWIRTTRVSYSIRTEYSAKALTAQLAIAAIGSIVEELDVPPDMAVVIGQWMGGAWLGAVLWPALWSVVIAALGALAQAAHGAIIGDIRDED